MKGFIILFDEFRENDELLKLMNDETNKILDFVCPDAKENFFSFGSTIEKKELLEMAMTYVYGKLLKEIREHYGYEIDLFNFLHNVVYDDDK